MAYTYTPGGNKLGDRWNAIKWIMNEKGLHREWNEIAYFLARLPSGTGVTISGGRTFAEIDLSAAGDVTPAPGTIIPVPKTFQDPGLNRVMPGYAPVGGIPVTEQIIGQGFSS